MEINKLRSLIEDKIQHDYVDGIIQRPAIDDVKLVLLYTMMKQSKLPQPKIEQYILATVFVQLALDIHEIVPVANDRTENSSYQRKRQLMVLAGDYYSGLFYSLLTETEDFTVIHTLATSIREINENKMRFYYNELDSVEEAFNVLMKIESLLITGILKQVQVLPDNFLIEDIILLHTLINEKHLLDKHGEYTLLKGIDVNGVHDNELHDELISNIENKKKTINKSLEDIPSHFPDLKCELSVILTDILEDNTSIAKEG
ncbi:heptaprenyl diphosphate synthase component 1 [Virgibacillus flavescens]|uniref:heptaprenyl diphosphate synthase component 1 n=1 Tax=Virgibacillus flavescens TaxID=1611422 RepID=UPI003D34AA72